MNYFLWILIILIPCLCLLTINIISTAKPSLLIKNFDYLPSRILNNAKLKYLLWIIFWIIFGISIITTLWILNYKWILAKISWLQLPPIPQNKEEAIQAQDQVKAWQICFWFTLTLIFIFSAGLGFLNWRSYKNLSVTKSDYFHYDWTKQLEKINITERQIYDIKIKNKLLRNQTFTESYNIEKIIVFLIKKLQKNKKSKLNSFALITYWTFYKTGSMEANFQIEPGTRIFVLMFSVIRLLEKENIFKAINSSPKEYIKFLNDYFR